MAPWSRGEYPDDWAEISREAKTRAGWRCVGSPQYPYCRAAHGAPHPITGSIVVLTTGHRDHDPQNNDPANLAVWCQRCHLAHDADHHARNAALTRWERRCIDQPNLFAVPE